MTDARPTEEIVLTDSKAKVTFYKFLTSGQYRAIQKSMMDAVKVRFGGNNFNTPMIDDLAGSLMLDQQDLVLSYIVKGIITSEGEVVENIKDFVDGLSIEDGQEIYEKVDTLSAASSLSKEDKKK